jgi:hypothetical protein
MNHDCWLVLNNLLRGRPYHYAMPLESADAAWNWLEEREFVVDGHICTKGEEYVLLSGMMQSELQRGH